MQRFTPPLAHAARPCRHAVGDRWQADETYVKVAGHWRYVYRAVDQFGQVVDVFVSRQRDAAAAHRSFQRAIGVTKGSPVEITTDRAPVYPAVLEELLPAAWHRADRYANNRIECDHGRLKSRLRRHCCIEPECAGEAQQRRGPPSWKDAKRVEPLDHAHGLSP